MHFPTNTHARTHTHPPAQKVENIHRRRRNDGRSAVALWVFPTGGVLHEGGGHTPQLTVFQKNVVRGHRDSASRLRLLLFFFSNRKAKECTDSRSGPRTQWTRRHRSVFLPSRDSFFFLFFHKQTLVKSVADRFFSPPPTMRLTSRKRHLLLRHVHTEFFSFFFSLFFFFVQQYQRGAKAKMIHTQRERKKNW